MQKTEATMTEQRFVDLETKLAHQEHLLLELNEIITKQQENIMRLEKLCDSIIERVRSLSEAAPADLTVDEKPPHY
jgi:SlyX protein